MTKEVRRAGTSGVQGRQSIRVNQQPQTPNQPTKTSRSQQTPADRHPLTDITRQTTHLPVRVANQMPEGAVSFLMPLQRLL